MPESRGLSFLRWNSKQIVEEAKVDTSLRSNLKKTGNKSSNGERRVAFSHLEIHEFLIQIGDNPACEGAPLCISRECQNQRVIEVNEFEANRKDRRRRKELVLSATRRSRLLMALGYSMEDIASAALETQRVRQEREESMDNQKWDRFNLIYESTRRKLKKVVGKNKPQAEQSTVASRTA